MNPADKITALEEKRGALESQLLVVGISEQKEHDIHQRIIAIDGQITMWGGRLPPQTNKWQMLAVAAGMSISVTLLGYRGWARWRHNTFASAQGRSHWKYTSRQLARREMFYQVASQGTMGAIDFTPKEFICVSIESLGRVMALFAFVSFIDLMHRWSFWKKHPQLLAVASPEEDVEGTLVDWNPYKPKATVEINGKLHTVFADQIRTNLWSLGADVKGTKVTIRLTK